MDSIYFRFFYSVVNVNFRPLLLSLCLLSACLKRRYVSSADNICIPDSHPWFGEHSAETDERSLLERWSHPVWVSAECIGGCLMNSSMRLSAAWVVLLEGWRSKPFHVLPRSPAISVSDSCVYRRTWNVAGGEIMAAVNDIESCHLLGCYVMWLLLEQTFLANVSPASSESEESTS
jgi:hypothetical protein